MKSLLETYLFFLNEKLEDIKINEKDRKWYDIINKKVKERYKSEIEKIFAKNFKINHKLIDSKKTIIEVKPSLLRMLFDVQINLFTKKGESIHDKGIFSDIPLSFHIYKKKNKWNVYFSTFFVKDQYQNQGLSKVVLTEVKKVLRLIQNQREMLVRAVDVGVYAWSRVEGTRFVSESDHKILQKLYEDWDRKVNKNLNPKKLKKPKDYPKEFLLSEDYAPIMFPYIIPF